jgi:hypothetical protein
LQVDLGSSKPPEEIVLPLLPSGVISGKILDDGDEPVAGCTIQLHRPRIGNSLSREAVSGSSDDQGNFRLEPLPPDRYVLSAKCEDDLPAEHILDVNPARGFEIAETWQRVFYQDSLTFGGATELGVAAGREVLIELHVKPQSVKTLRGVVTSSPGTPPKKLTQVYLARTGNGLDPTEYENDAVNMEDGSFRFVAVEPGSYILSAQSWDAASETRYWARLPVTVGETAPARVELRLQPMPGITGRVQLGPVPVQVQPAKDAQGPDTATGQDQPDDPQPKGILTFTPVPRADQLSDYQATVNPKDGAFRVPGIPPGRWKVHYYSQRQPAWIESIQYGDASREDREIEVAPASAAPLLIRASTQFAGTSFDLKIPSNAPRSSWVVYAVPETTLRLDAPVVAAIGFPETLSLVTKLPPGPYRFFAAPRTSGGGVFNERFAELLSRQVEPVEISTNLEKTIEVRCFLDAEVQRVINSYIAGDAR